MTAKNKINKLIHFLKHCILIYASTLLSFCFAIIFTPVFKKNLPDNDWKIYTAYLAISGFIMVIDIGYTQLLFRDIIVENNKKQIYQNYTKICATVGVLLSAGGAAYAHLILENIDLNLETASLLGICLFLQYILVPQVTAIHALKNNFTHLKYSSATWLIRYTSITYLASTESITIKSVFILLSITYFIELVYFTRSNNKSLNAQIDQSKNLNILIFCKERFYAITTILIGSIGSQIDRLFAINNLTANDFNEFITLSTFGTIILSSQYPIIRYITPRINLINQKLGTQTKITIATTAAISTALILTLAPSIYSLWIKTTLSSEIKLSVYIYMCGVVLQALYNITYQILLHKSDTKKILEINLISIILPLLLYATLENSIISASLIFTVPCAARFIIGTVATKSIFFKFTTSNK